MICKMLISGVRKRYRLAFLSIMAPVSIVCQEPFVDINSCHVHASRQRRKQFCYISFVEINGVKYLVKQKRNYNQILGAVYDVLASRVAETLDPDIAHKVILIPAFKKFPGKKHASWPATLHTLASGRSVKAKRSIYRKMNIKLALHGLTRSMIYWMAKHQQLVKIIALDIFLCNNDRHQGNLFYNKKRNTFCAIDMDCLFKYSLAYFSYYSLLSMMEEGMALFSDKEVLVLVELKNVLDFLVNKHTSEDIIATFDLLVQEAGLDSSSLLWTLFMQTQLSEGREIIRRNYTDVKRVIVLLQDMINQAVAVRPELRRYQEIQLVCGER